jgi:ubiquinone/menaquinone biosynthesis C-methylase UbiE
LPRRSKRGEAGKTERHQIEAECSREIRIGDFQFGRTRATALLCEVANGKPQIANAAGCVTGTGEMSEDTARPHARYQYKDVWTALSDTIDRAKMHIVGSSEESDFETNGVETLRCLQETVGIRPNDVVLEIGCGIGRVGKQVAPLCRRWIGCDVSKNMLQFAAERLRGLTNVELKETSGYSLEGIADASCDVVYCTVVFMHLESWDRYAYVLEAARILRAGGRVYLDNANLCSDEGWVVFEAHRRLAPKNRPAHMGECSTPQELETYLQRAGFRDVRLRTGELFVRAWGVKS